MAIDPTIALQARNPTFDNPVNALAQMLQAQGIQQQNQLGQYQLARAQRADADTNALADIYRTAVKADGSLDRNALLQGAATRGLGAQIPGIQKGFADQDKAAADSKKTQYEVALQKIDIGSRILSGARDEPSYQQAKAQLMSTLGPEAAAQMPANFDPVAVQSLMSQGLAIKDRIAAEHQKALLAETGRHNVATEGLTAQGQQVTMRGQDMTSASAAAATGATIRGQNLTDARGRESNDISRSRLAMDQQAPKGVLDPERGLLVDPRTGEARPITMAGAPVGAKKPTEGQQRVSDAKEVLSLLDEAEKILPKATNSYAGTARDKALGAVGMSTEGAQGAAQLKALQGALVSKMPKMSGPQSDKDVLLYREMAGQIGDSTIPAATRKSAVDTIRKLNEKYAGMEEGSSKPVSGAPADIADILKKYK